MIANSFVPKDGYGKCTSCTPSGSILHATARESRRLSREPLLFRSEPLQRLQFRNATSPSSLCEQRQRPGNSFILFITWWSMSTSCEDHFTCFALHRRLIGMELPVDEVGIGAYCRTQMSDSVTLNNPKRRFVE